MSEWWRRLGSPWSVRSLVLGLILVTLLPLLAFSAFLVTRAAEHEQALLADTVQKRTRSTARDIEQNLAELRGQLFLLANAGNARPGRFAALYRQAAAMPNWPGLTMTLTAADGSEVLDTGHPLDAGPSAPRDMGAVRHVLRTGRPWVSDMTFSGPDHTPAVTIDVPVLQDGRVTYVASLNVLPRVQQVLLREQFPPGWIATIGDRSGFTLARTRNPEEFVGQPPRAAFLQRVDGKNDGWFPISSREGIPLYVAFNRVIPVGWMVVVGIPTATLYAPMRHSIEGLVLVGASTLAVALLLAWLLGRSIARPIASLVEYAALAGRGGPVPLRLTGLRETDAVARTLHRASADLHRSAAEEHAAMSALSASEERKQVLQQAVLAQEAERTRIARELHDSLGQYLTALQLGLSALARRWAGNAEAMDQLAKLRDLTAQVGGEVNRMAWELRPTALDDLGLEMAITQYLEEWSERTQIRFDLQIDLGSRRLPQTVEITVYRALQEAITNVVRHANASQVAVLVKATGQQLQLIVEDDGTGFVFDEADGPPETLGLGLRGMRERLALVEGTLAVETSPRHGTALFVRVPL